jgi:nitrogen PTS system EIIA component
MQLTVRDVAGILTVSEKTVYRWISQGLLPAYRVNEQYRFNRAELLEWATSRKINVSPEIFQEPEGAGASLPGFVEALQAGGVYYRIGGADKESVLKAVVETMHLPDEVDREFLFRVLLAREALGSTAVGDGIAIPHVRNPIVLHVTRPAITLCFLEQPIEFGALDGKPVFALFSLISPTARAHLHLLSRLAFTLNDPGFKDAVRRQASRDEILAAARRVETGLKRPADPQPPGRNAPGSGDPGPAPGTGVPPAGSA